MRPLSISLCPQVAAIYKKKKKKRTKKEFFFFREYGGVVYILYRRPMEACGIG